MQDASCASHPDFPPIWGLPWRHERQSGRRQRCRLRGWWALSANVTVAGGCRKRNSYWRAPIGGGWRRGGDQSAWGLLAAYCQYQNLSRSKQDKQNLNQMLIRFSNFTPFNKIIFSPYLHAQVLDDAVIVWSRLQIQASKTIYTGEIWLADRRK